MSIKKYPFQPKMSVNFSGDEPASNEVTISLSKENMMHITILQTSLSYQFGFKPTLEQTFMYIVRNIPNPSMGYPGYQVPPQMSTFQPFPPQPLVYPQQMAPFAPQAKHQSQCPPFQPGYSRGLGELASEQNQPVAKKK